MKHSKLLDAAIVAALLLAHVPGLAQEIQPTDIDSPHPIALIVPQSPDTPDNSAERLY